MKAFFKLFIVAFTLMLLATVSFSQTQKYKCLLQMSNYTGEGAYIVVSLINPQGAYEKTLCVLGEDKKWYSSLKEWNKFYTKKTSNLSAITGASVSGGNRSINTIEIEDSKINKGYKLKFETSVENQKYHANDLVISLTSEGITEKVTGTGYIQYVRLIKN